MSRDQGNWYLDIDFPHPYSGIEITTDATGVKISIPFHTELSAETALDEMRAVVLPRFEVIPGEVLKGETGC